MHELATSASSFRPQNIDLCKCCAAQVTNEHCHSGVHTSNFINNDSCHQTCQQFCRNVISETRPRGNTSQIHLPSTFFLLTGLTGPLRCSFSKPSSDTAAGTSTILQQQLLLINCVQYFLYRNLDHPTSNTSTRGATELSTVQSCPWVCSHRSRAWLRVSRPTQQLCMPLPGCYVAINCIIPTRSNCSVPRPSVYGGERVQVHHPHAATTGKLIINCSKAVFHAGTNTEMSL